MNEQDIIHYLQQSPDFFERNPKALMHLELPHKAGGVSLVERQVKVLRDKNRELQGQLIDMLRSAQENEDLLEKCVRLVVCLIDCNSLEEMASTLDDVLKREFDLQAISLSLIGHWPKVAQARIYSDGSVLMDAVDCQFPEDQPICGRLDSKTQQALFSSIPYNKGSVAILPLGKQAQLGMLGLFSKSESRFSPEMGSTFLELISAVTTQMLLKFKDF